MLNWHDVESNNLKRVAYIEWSETLYIQFQNDRVYSYVPVPQFFFDQLLNPNIPDKGDYFNKFIRGAYDYQEVTGTINPPETDSLLGQGKDSEDG